MSKKLDNMGIRLTNRPGLLLAAAVSPKPVVRLLQMSVDAIILLGAKVHKNSPLLKKLQFFPAL